jgi:diketogulonate reductase-like aldo/keto reductase
MKPDFVYGTAWKEERTADLITAALHAGFRAIDTANQRKHYFEAGVGEALADAYRKKLVQRGDLWLQTKFTYLPGQDHRLPYDPHASLTDQVAQSMASSLEHLGTTYVDSYVLHGPAAGVWTEYDDEVWRAMVREREAGRARVLGVSNVRMQHLAAMPEKPAFVQNRCYARLGWDREVREWCRDNGVIYQGFSLLTANPEVFRHPLVHQIAAEHQATLPQIVFAFARGVGMLPLTGTSSPEHMQQDLASLKIQLSPEQVAAIESLVA